MLRDDRDQNWDKKAGGGPPAPLENTHFCPICGTDYPYALKDCGCGECFAKLGVKVTLESFQEWERQ